MSDVTYPITPQSLPSGFCPATWQAILNAFAANLFVTIPGQNNQLVVSATKPTDTTVAWLQLDTSGRPTRIYYFAQGAWLSLHPLQPGATLWLFDVLPDFNTYDGGDALGAGLYTGPMWQQAKTADGTLIAARFPIAAGTLPSGTVLAVGDTGGEEQHSLTVEEMPPHSHVIKAVTPIENKWAGNDSGAGQIVTGNNAIIEGDTPILNNEPFFEAQNTGGSGTPPVVNSHENMPPWVCGNLIQRTDRLYYRIDG